MNKLKTLLAGGALALAPGLAWADSHVADSMGGMDHSGTGMGAMPEHMRSMMDAMQEMNQAMPTESSGDADADFLLMMIPHHESAIAMARIELEQGDDEETRAMAQAIVDAQEAEIEEMRAMLERMGVEPPAAPAQ